MFHPSRNLVQTATAAGDHPLTFPLWGAMGGAATMGLGLATAQPDKRVMVMTGDGDAGSPPHMSEAMAREIPNAQLKIFERQQHMMLVLDGDHVSQVMSEFLDSL